MRILKIKQASYAHFGDFIGIWCFHPAFYFEGNIAKFAEKYVDGNIAIESRLFIKWLTLNTVLLNSLLFIIYLFVYFYVLHTSKEKKVDYCTFNKKTVVKILTKIKVFCYLTHN